MTAGDEWSDSLLVWNGVLARVPALADAAAHETFEKGTEALEEQGSGEAASSSSEALPASRGGRPASPRDAGANPF